MKTLFSRHLTTVLWGIGGCCVLLSLIIFIFLLKEKPLGMPLLSQPELTVEVTEEEVIFTLLAAEGQIIAEGIPIRISLASAAGPIVKSAKTQGKKTQINIPYVRAGITPYEFSIAEFTMTGALERQAARPIGPLELKVGARMSRVTPDRKPALVVHPVDAQDNVTSLPVAVQVDLPGGGNRQHTIQVEHLYAWMPLQTGSTVGKMNVSAVTAEMRGERGEVDLVSGRPATAQFASRQDEAPASGRDTWLLDLANTKDRLGNPVDDGTAIDFVGRSLSLLGASPLNFYVTRPAIQAGQSLLLPSYPRAGDYALEVRAGTYNSQEILLKASPVSETKIEAYWLATEPLSLAVNSIYSDLGSFVDDGTLLDLNIYAQDQLVVKLNKALKNGALNWTLPPLPSNVTHLETCLAGSCARLEIDTAVIGQGAVSVPKKSTEIVLPELDFLNAETSSINIKPEPTVRINMMPEPNKSVTVNTQIDILDIALIDVAAEVLEAPALEESSVMIQELELINDDLEEAQTPKLDPIVVLDLDLINSSNQEVQTTVKPSIIPTLDFIDEAPIPLSEP